jgi:glycosyltransferase involved in cell wall biosynthesis
MRVARIVERLPPNIGGKEIHVAELTRALASLGASQEIFFRDGNGVQGAVRHWRIHGGTFAEMHPLIAYCGRAVRSVVRSHRREPFDVIHAHGDFVEAAAAAILSRHLRIPAILTVHGGLSDAMLHNDARLCTFSAMHSIITVSAEIATDLRSIGVAAPTTVMPSAVRDDFFNDRGGFFGPERVIAVGRLSPVKGIEYLIAAHDQLSEREIEWVIVGGGTGEYADDVRREISRRPRMKIIDEDDAATIAALLRSSSVFVLPSVRQRGQEEGVPTALLEAVAGGVPVVASRTGGLAELFRGRDVGWLTDPGDVGSLTAAICECLDDPGKAEQRARAARAHLPIRTWSEVAQKVLGIYERAIADSRRRSALLVLPWFDFGGAEYFALSVARGLAERGVRTAIAAAPGGLVDELDNDLEFVPLRRLHSLEDAWHNLLCLTGNVIRRMPDAVNSHHIPLGLAARASCTCALTRSRHVLTLHTTEDPRMAPVVGWAGAYAFDRVLFVADSVRDEFIGHAPRWRRQRFSVVHVGVELPALQVKDRRCVINVARLISRKGHATLLEAWRRVAADGRASDWELELWGDGPEARCIKSELLTVPQARLVGSVPRASEKLGRYPIVVLPSIREGLPLTLVEAMAAGCAVVASDIPGCRELLGESAGILVPAGDPHALAEALLKLIESPERVAELGSAARTRIAVAFSRRRMVSRYYEEMFREATRQPNSADVEDAQPGVLEGSRPIGL